MNIRIASEKSLDDIVSELLISASSTLSGATLVMARYLSPMVVKRNMETSNAFQFPYRDTIWLVREPRNTWKERRARGGRRHVSNVIAHEELHKAVERAEGDKTSKRLDTRFALSILGPEYGL